MQKVLVVGGGLGGLAILQILKDTTLTVEAVVDPNPNAPGMKKAKEEGVRTGSDWRDFLNDSIDIVFDVTGDEEVFYAIRNALKSDMTFIPGSIAYLFAKLMEEKGGLIAELKRKTYTSNLIFNSTDDGMVVINTKKEIILFNKSAEKITNISQSEAIGKQLETVLPHSSLSRVLETGKMEANQKLQLKNGLNVIATQIPMMNEDNELIGALSVFKDRTEFIRLAEKVTNLKEVQTMLEAIIHSSNDAISVVDENGKGLLINPAYTRMTGLTSKQVVGKPATADISEGDSMHFKVLQTRQPVRGVKMKVGPHDKEVIVNVAPVIVDGKLKGSVGILHDMSEIQQLTKELDRAKQIIRTLEAKYTFADIIGKSEKMNIAIEQAKLGANTPATVLLRGKSGTGKELFAHAIHNASARRYNKFIRVNCAAISDSLLESELFGYDEGAFTGAKRGGKKGLFEEANNGSIFLDEIGELSANTQAKLLRVLQENEIVRVGGTKAIPINVRIIAATHVNLEKGIAEGTFREDLYYRLNQIPIYIPPLKERKEDIPLLSKSLIVKMNQAYGRNIEGITDEAMQKLLNYAWPGNVRELENILARAIIFMKFNEDYIDLQHLQFMDGAYTSLDSNDEKRDKKQEEKKLSDLLHDYEKKIILEKIKENNGNKMLTARQLGISIRNLYYKLEKFHVDENSMQ